MSRGVKHQNQTCFNFPTEAVEVVTSQSTQVGVIKTVRSVEEERNVTTVLLVVALDYLGGTQNSRQQQLQVPSM